MKNNARNTYKKWVRAISGTQQETKKGKEPAIQTHF